MIETFDTRIAGLYIGCKCDITWNLANGTVEVWPDEVLGTKTLYELGEGKLSVVPNLRSLESLTEEEARELYRIKNGRWDSRPEWLDTDAPDCSCLGEWWNNTEEFYVDGRVFMIGSPLVWLKLLEWGFDLFGLIPAGLAKEIPAQ